MSPRIVIIGAGAAGIAAATKLFEIGLRNLTILEAEHRIGGRLHTVPFAENVVDMGAQWCHGEKNNVVHEMASKFDVFSSTTTTYDRFLFIRSDGVAIEQEKGDKLMLLAIQIVEHHKDEMAKYSGSLGDFITKKFNEAIRTDEYKDFEPELAYQFLEFFHKYENSIECSDSWFDTSCSGYCEYWDCDGDRLLNWKDKGYATILDILMKKFPSGQSAEIQIEKNIEFGKEVISIDWLRTDSKPSEVTCLDGSKYFADHIICTTSLGVLKDRHLSLFKPELPRSKRDAIDGLTIGTVNKIYLEFDKAFWPKGWNGFSTLWNKSDLNELREHKLPWLEDVFGFYTVDFQPNILCGWIFGESARKMEMCSEDDVLEGSMHLLRKFLKSHYNVPNPINMKRSTWYSNPHFRGSYTFRSMTTDLLRTSPSKLAEPLVNVFGVPVLQFAGEATHDHYYSTVHGAIESGWREAKRLGQLYNERKSHL